LHLHTSALSWLRGAPWTKSLVVEAWSAEIEAEIIRDFPSYPQMRARNQAESKTKELSAMLSMHRKIKLANALRVKHERGRGAPYACIMRVRPDIAYGVRVELPLLLSMLHDSSSSRMGTLLTPLPPPNEGGVWRICRQLWDPMRAQSCCRLRGERVARGGGQCDAAVHNASTCLPSPLLESIGFHLYCPCCSRKLNRWRGRNVCGCPHLFSHTGPRWSEADGANGTRVISPNTNSFLVLDQIAVGDGPGIDAFSSVYDHLETIFRAQPKRLVGSFVSEKLLAQRAWDCGIRRYGGPVWLQWGTRKDTVRPESRDRSTHRGGRCGALVSLRLGGNATWVVRGALEQHELLRPRTVDRRAVGVLRPRLARQERVLEPPAQLSTPLVNRGAGFSLAHARTRFSSPHQSVTSLLGSRGPFSAEFFQ
jgi:hypothetical protein